MKAPKLKIDWSECPSANYAAMDKNGTWTFFDDEPIIADDEFVCDFTSLGFQTVEFSDWKSTLQKRPKNKRVK